MHVVVIVYNGKPVGAYLVTLFNKIVQLQTSYVCILHMHTSII